MCEIDFPHLHNTIQPIAQGEAVNERSRCPSKQPSDVKPTRRERASVTSQARISAGCVAGIPALEVGRFGKAGPSPNEEGCLVPAAFFSLY